MTTNTTALKSWMPEISRPGVVSVIVPAYNRAHLVGLTLDSVFAQTWRPIELIVIDDGSTDETPSVLKSWAAQHRSQGFEVRLLLQRNAGAQVARNRGLIESTGEYIQFLDSDDRILAQKLSTQVEYLRNTGADYCYARTEGIDSEGTCVGLEGSPECLGRPWIMERSWHTSSPLYLRHVCRDLGPWNESLLVWQDYEYSARIKSAGFHGVFLDAALCQSFEHDGPSISRQKAEAYVPAVLRAVDSMLPLAPASGRRARIERNRIAQYLANLALRCAKQGDANTPRLCLSKARAISRGAVKLPMTVIMLTCMLVPPRTALEFGWSIARLLKRAGGMLSRRDSTRKLPEFAADRMRGVSR